MKKKYYIITMILLAVCSLSLIFYILVDKKIISFSSKEKELKEEEKINDQNQNKEETNDIVEELDINGELAQKYFNIYNENNNKNSYLFKDLNDSQEAKIYLAISQLDENNFETIPCSQVQNLILEESYYCDNGSHFNSGTTLDNETLKQNTTNFLKNSTLETKYKELFGKNTKYQLNDVKIMGGMYHYDSDLDGYISYSIEAGGLIQKGIQTLTRATKKGNSLELEIFENNSNINQPDKTITYTLTLEKETNNYIFTNRKEQ